MTPLRFLLAFALVAFSGASGLPAKSEKGGCTLCLFPGLADLFSQKDDLSYFRNKVLFPSEHKENPLLSSFLSNDEDEFPSFRDDESPFAPASKPLESTVFFIILTSKPKPKPKPILPSLFLFPRNEKRTPPSVFHVDESDESLQKSKNEHDDQDHELTKDLDITPSFPSFPSPFFPMNTFPHFPTFLKLQSPPIPIFQRLSLRKISSTDTDKKADNPSAHTVTWKNPKLNLDTANVQDHSETTVLSKIHEEEAKGNKKEDKTLTGMDDAFFNFL